MSDQEDNDNVVIDIDDEEEDGVNIIFFNI